MNLDARLKKAEEQTEERLRADFCLCLMDQEGGKAYWSYLAARGVVYEPENPYIVTHSCPICDRERRGDLTVLNEEERAVWHRLTDWVAEGWKQKRRTGRNPEIPVEFTEPM